MDRWRASCASDAELAALAAGASVAFAVRSGDEVAAFEFREGAVGGTPERADFAVVAPPEAWARFFEAEPRPPYQSYFGMLMRVPGTVVSGDELCFAQHAHLVRRVLELGRTVIAGPGRTGRTPMSAVGPAGDVDVIEGRYLYLGGRGGARIFYERSGAGRDVLFLHTAGADGRQFHHLMNDARLVERCHMVAFDLPWHGRSSPAAPALPGSHALDTDGYVVTVMEVVEALGLDRPVVVGCSMGGEICLELALRYPDRLAGVVACEAADHVPGRQIRWARHPRVNQALFVPEWVDGLMAPQSPPEHRREVWWCYSQGGFNTFFGDILFYSGDWDGRDRVERIDAVRCPVVMMTGEYDYSCTPDMSRLTAERIPGAVFRTMPGLGHFPMAENPPAFGEHLLWALDEIDGRSTIAPGGGTTG